MSATQELTAPLCCQRSNGGNGLFYQIECQGDTLRLMAGQHHEGCGAACHPVDSGEKGFCLEPRWWWTPPCLPDCGAAHLRPGLRRGGLARSGRQWQAAAARAAGRTIRGPRLRAICYGPPLTPSADCWLSLQPAATCGWLSELAATGSQAPAITFAGTCAWSGDHMVDYPPVHLPGARLHPAVTCPSYNSMLQDMEERRRRPCPGQLDAGGRAGRELLGIPGAAGSASTPSGSRTRRARGQVPPWTTMRALYTPAGVRRSVRRLTGRDAAASSSISSVDPNRPECRNPVPSTAACTATTPTASSSCWTRTPLPPASRMERFLRAHAGAASRRARRSSWCC